MTNRKVQCSCYPIVNFQLIKLKKIIINVVFTKIVIVYLIIKYFFLVVYQIYNKLNNYNYNLNIIPND